MKNSTMLGSGLTLVATAAAAVVLGSGVPTAEAAGGHGGRTIEVTVTITNLAPDGGTFLTPVWVAFHDGSFDTHDIGAPAPAALERLAEDGNTAPLAAAFEMSGAGNVEATLPADMGIPPLAPGETATMTFELSGRDAANRYFSYASMVLPSNDAFIANDNPTTHLIFNRGGRFRGADFIIRGSRVADAGTELNDEDPMNTAFFGQQTEDTGQDESVVAHDHNGFKFAGSGGILDDSMFANADFTARGYKIARITITADRRGGGGHSDD